ncbi:hypothetical protein GCM10010251_46040 [Streptomyces aurantiogriseus]|uniref:Uncharacterized protein n=1 Tax=Streptomyces aurantiogriseus TaxID=66870 RepID=A0A918CJQ8_9ACTN|nr:hypothetical protein GCM10010251_46040 [Streptomyces aurantiogriseus]
MPEPVGATTSTSEPSRMACHAPAWAAVGAENAPVNQPRVAGEKPSRARCASLTMRPSCTQALTMALTCGCAAPAGLCARVGRVGAAAAPVVARLLVSGGVAENGRYGGIG